MLKIHANLKDFPFNVFVMVTNTSMALFHFDRMNPFNSVVHQIDTREGPALTVFDGSRVDESKLATQFWNSVVLIPPVESTLVCKEIKQRIRSHTLKEGTTKPRFSTTKPKIKEDKTMRDKIYDEAAAYQQAKDEAKQVRAVENRNAKVRQLFRQQSKANRAKNEQWIPPPQFLTQPIHTQQFPNEINQKQQEDDDYDRQLVCSLPD